MLLAGLVGCSVWSGAQGHACDRTDDDRAQASRVIARVSAEINEMDARDYRGVAVADRAVVGVSGAKHEGGGACDRYADEAPVADCAGGRGDGEFARARGE